MSLPSRVGFLLVAGCLASSTRAVEVTLELSSVVNRVCHPDRYGEGGYCDADVPATLSPSAPRGGGDLQLDATGNLIRGSLSLEAFSVDGVAVPAWSGDVQLGLPAPASGWPVPGGNVSGAHISYSRFASQSDFAGTLHLWRSGVGAGVEQDLVLTFASVPRGVVACPGETLFLDDDGDGKVNSRDAWIGSSETQFGDAIDSEGRLPLEFCALQGDTPTKCARLDFRNDEPLKRRAGDCHRVAQPTYSDWSASDWQCEPAELVYRSEPPTAPARSCLGFAVIDDADGDGEPDTTDRCAGTPPGSAIDGNGCSAEQFCSQQSVQLCRRADFRNDEPLAKQPGDCARTRSKPRACAPAAPR